MYKPSKNINEKAKLQPSCLYSKNKIITEKKLIYILDERVLILRISNLIGLNLNQRRSRKIHDTFINIFLRNVRKNYVTTIKKFIKIFYLLKNFVL